MTPAHALYTIAYLITSSPGPVILLVSQLGDGFPMQANLVQSPEMLA